MGPPTEIGAQYWYGVLLTATLICDGDASICDTDARANRMVSSHTIGTGRSESIPPEQREVTQRIEPRSVWVRSPLLVSFADRLWIEFHCDSSM